MQAFAGWECLRMHGGLCMWLDRSWRQRMGSLSAKLSGANGGNLAYLRVCCVHCRAVISNRPKSNRLFGVIVACMSSRVYHAHHCSGALCVGSVPLERPVAFGAAGPAHQIGNDALFTMKRLFVRWKKPTSTVFAFGLPVGGSICTREDGARLTGGRTARLARQVSPPTVG